MNETFRALRRRLGDQIEAGLPQERRRGVVANLSVTTPDGYPVNTLGDRARFLEILMALKERGIFSQITPEMAEALALRAILPPSIEEIVETAERQTRTIPHEFATNPIVQRAIGLHEDNQRRLRAQEGARRGFFSRARRGVSRALTPPCLRRPDDGFEWI